MKALARTLTRDLRALAPTLVILFGRRVATAAARLAGSEGLVSAGLNLPRGRR